MSSETAEVRVPFRIVLGDANVLYSRVLRDYLLYAMTKRIIRVQWSAGGDKTVNRDLEAKARAVAGLKAYITNMAEPSPDFVIGAYHQLWHVEKSFRMSKHDLRARPVYHRKRDSIDAHLNVVFAALAITRLIEDRTGWSIKKFVRTARRYRTVQIRAGNQIITAADPLPAELRDALALIN